MSITRNAVSALALLLSVPLAGCTATNMETQSASSAAPAKQTESEKLHALFASSDEAYLKRDPLSAIGRGDLRYADQFGDYISDAYYDAERKAAQDELDALHALDRGQLSTVDQIAYDVFEQDRRDTLKALSPAILDASKVRPINHFTTLQTYYPNFSSGSGAALFKTVADYENALKRHLGYVRFLDASIERMREGLASGVVETKMTIDNTIVQLDTLLAQPVEESPFYGPVTMFPDAVPPADRDRLTAAYKDMIVNQLNPAHKRLRDFLKNEYVAHARMGVGLVYMKGGTALYDYLIEHNTTLPLSADYVHELGLSEVARIRKQMDEIRVETGFKGSLAQFFTYLRDDAKFHPQSRQWMTDKFYEIGKAVDALVPQQFSTIPKTPLEIRPYPEYREQYEAGASYEDGTPDGSRPGIFYFNAYDLPSRSIPGMTTLYLHEAAPGHHFQVSLANENEALPAFMRFGGNTAYVEGWALYAETLGYDFGLYKDPYQRMGHLNDEMLRAMRLVVDSGLHAKRWTREQAIQYMLDNSSMGKTDAIAEVERYIAMPGQALAYKIGALTIQRLKHKAKDALGDRFDVREFHAQVLMTGALPMSILEKKIDDWIAARKAA